MPSEAKSVFWGRWAPRSGAPATIGLHVYALYAPEFKQAQTYERSEKQMVHYALDVFALKPKLHLVSRTFFADYPGVLTPLYGMSFAWLDPKTKKIPLLVIRDYCEGDYGPYGREVFVAFADGWTGLADVMNLKFGGWHASDTSGQNNELQETSDEYLQIQSKLGPTTGELSQEQIDRSYTFTFKWNAPYKNFYLEAKDPAGGPIYNSPY